MQALISICLESLRRERKEKSMRNIKFHFFTSVVTWTFHHVHQKKGMYWYALQIYCYQSIYQCPHLYSVKKRKKRSMLISPSIKKNIICFLHIYVIVPNKTYVGDLTTPCNSHVKCEPDQNRSYNCPKKNVCFIFPITANLNVKQRS